MKTMWLGVAVMLAAAWIPAATGADAGKVLSSQGVTSLQRKGEADRLVGKGEALQEGDVVSTGASSFAVVELGDGSRMTLRPGTAFAVEKFSAEQGQESAFLRLFRGGLRTITGFISKRNPNAYRVTTSTATIGIRGTDFDVRVCKQDCGNENKALAQAGTVAAPRASLVVARAVTVKGQLSARGAGAAARIVVPGGPVYAGDMLETGADGHAVLAFRDETRVTLQPGTRFEVESYSLRAGSRDEGEGVFRLVKGALRVFTGLIAKARPANFRLNTPTATIGIRGTGFDAVQGEPCPKEEKNVSVLCTPDALFVSTWEGAIELKTLSGSQEVKAGQAAYAAGADKAPELLTVVPAFLRENTFPRPDATRPDFQQLFGAAPLEATPEGVYVWVRDGHVTLARADALVELGRGESGYAGPAPGEVARLDAAPFFMRFDPLPRPDQVQGEGMVPLFRGPGDLIERNECSVL